MTSKDLTRLFHYAEHDVNFHDVEKSLIHRANEEHYESDKTEIDSINLGLKIASIKGHRYLLITNPSMSALSHLYNNGFGLSSSFNRVICITW